ncbi:M56 family metallopeptidase [Cesiribacter andamanensis]|uniref:Outer membrane protein omp85 n=1 Tax=Cesiribacter andamanensis AMV16 TaxID=1279009 RepID=M7N1B4_9BACT|nr:M56 family metallopeptidase [Cesiribacter andamanensis]EMR01087.1 Outer membrane protein omp85 precursor [Cesiribacter andamanensis AMV16]
MLLPYFGYLIEVSISLAVFALAYRLFFVSLTPFGWNRAYLLAALLLSVLLPLLPLPHLLANGAWSSLPAADLSWLKLEGLATPGPVPAPGRSGTGQTLPAGTSYFRLLGAALALLYLAGCLYKGGQLLHSLLLVKNLLRHNPKEPQAGYILVRTRQGLAPFSFLRYIFLPQDGPMLSAEEAELVLRHEQHHLEQRHSLDVLLYEGVTVFFWFHPALYYLSASLRRLHEFQVDAALTRTATTPTTYGRLLLKLASLQGTAPILHTFSSKELVHRIQMLTQPPSTPMQKLKFLAALPALAVALALSSFFHPSPPAASPEVPTSLQRTETDEMEPLVIKSISWSGNTVYTEARLNQVLGLKPGDPYTRAELEARLNFTPESQDISSLYMDQGYLYFSLKIDDTNIANNAVALQFTLQEGPQARVSEVNIKGNTNISSAELLRKINIKAGELFSRAKLIRAQQALVQTGMFNPETIGITPIPNPEAGTVALEFTVEEL